MPDTWEPVPIGQGIVRRSGSDITVAGVGVSVHRAMQAADRLAGEGLSMEIIDLRTVTPLDEKILCASVSKTGRLLVVDEDYLRCGLSGELAAVVLEKGIACKFARVCVEKTIPYCPDLEAQALPNTARIVEAAKTLI